MSDDNWFTAPASADPHRGRLELGDKTKYCTACRMIHHVDLACEIVRARVEAMIIEPGDELRDDDLEGVARVELLSALRLRGISVEVRGDGTMVAVRTVAA